MLVDCADHIILCQPFNIALQKKHGLSKVKKKLDWMAIAIDYNIVALIIQAHTEYVCIHSNIN